MANSLFQILSISRQDMLSRLQDLDNTSNNLANVNTVGYKRTRANFQELLKNEQLSGTYLKSTQVMPDQGSVKPSDDPLHLAIQGEGFFPVQLQDGTTGYTRDGQFTLDSNGTIVNASGMPLIWDGQLPAGTEEVNIQPTGEVFARQGTTWTQAGVLQLARFPNPTALKIQGENTYVETANSGAAVLGQPGSENFGQIRSHSLEQSNINIADELTHLMTLQRSFQISVRTFQQTDQMIDEAIHVRKG